MRAALSPWVTFALAIAIGLIAAAGVDWIDRAGHDAHQAELTVTRIRVILEEFERLNLEFKIQPERALEFGARFNSHAAEAQMHLDDLATFAPGAQQQQLQAAFTHLVDTIHQARAIAMLDPGAVDEYIAEVGAPAGISFGAILKNAEADYRDLAANQRQMARLGMWGVLIAATICAGILMAFNEHLRRKATRLLQRQEAHFRALVQHGADLITVISQTGVVRFQSPSVQGLLGFDAGEIERHPFDALVLQDDRRTLDRMLAESRANPQSPVKGELHLRHANGSWRTFEVIVSNLLDDPDVDGFVLTSRDVTERNEQADLVAYQATHDVLTGLPNRRLLLDRLTQSLARASRSGADCSLVFIDLDNFKSINDTFGHEAGDSLLKLVADRLVDTTRPGDTVARLGGDEFVVFLETAGTEEAYHVANRLAKAVRLPMVIDGRTLSVSVSIGLTTRESALDTPEELLRRADIAMYAVKRAGDSAPVVYEDYMNSERRDLVGIDTGEAILR